MEKKVQTNLEELDKEFVEEIDLYEYLLFALRKWKMIVACVLLCAVLAMVYVTTFATPIYQSTAQLYVVNSSNSVLNLSDLQIGTYLTSDYQLVFDTWEVNQQVIQNLKLPYTVKKLRNMTKVTNPSNTRALFVTVSSPNAKEAAQIANEFARVAQKYIVETMKSDEPTMLSMALESLEPVSPRKVRTLAIAIMLGVLLPLIILFVVFIMDDKVKTSSDVQKYTGVAPLAVIPVTDKSGSDNGRRYGR